MELLGLFCLCWTVSSAATYGGGSLLSLSAATSQDAIPVKGRGSNPAQEHEGPQPFFDPDVVRNVTAIATQTTFLHCRVKDLGLKAVSWIRQRDLHILTTGLFTYTSDQRFSVAHRTDATLSADSHVPGPGGLPRHVIHQPQSEDWILQIKYVQPRDSGVYECQVSTEPRISTDFHLTVIESKAKIVGPPEVYVKKGSTLSLTCLVSQAVENAAIFWYHDSNVLDNSGPHQAPPPSTSLNSASSVPRVSIDFSYDPVSSSLTSRLRINNLQVAHSGNYTCLPTAADQASVMVHVINGEHPAAMQHGNAAGAARFLSHSWSLLLVVVYLETCRLMTSLSPSVPWRSSNR